MLVKRKTDYLAHHGIAGQKRGIRRYQLANGTYTEEGNKRYRKKEEKEKKETPETNIYTGEPAKGGSTSSEEKNKEIIDSVLNIISPTSAATKSTKSKKLTFNSSTVKTFIKKGAEAVSNSSFVTGMKKAFKDMTSGVSTAFKDFFKYNYK